MLRKSAKCICAMKNSYDVDLYDFDYCHDLKPQWSQPNLLLNINYPIKD